MSEHEQKRQRREAALSELGGFGVQVNNGAGVTTEELESMVAVFGQRGGDKPAWTLTRGGLEEIVGRELTDDEVTAVVKTLEHSSIDDVIGDAAAMCGVTDEDDE